MNRRCENYIMSTHQLSRAEKLDFSRSIFFSCLRMILSLAWLTCALGSRSPPLSIVRIWDTLSSYRLDLFIFFS